NQVLDGAVVTRVISVERPDTAVPVATDADSPIEFEAPPERDATTEALRHGRILLVMRMGQRQLSARELAFSGTPGTVLLPTEKLLPPPRDPPYVPWTCAPVSDPSLGPFSPGEETCI